MAFIQVSFKTAQDRINVFKILKGESIIGRPVRNLVLSINQLEKIKEAGIPVYPASINGKNDYKKKI
ncbi:unnamed protein product, partial [marine sediment metagenome]